MHEHMHTCVYVCMHVRITVSIHTYMYVYIIHMVRTAQRQHCKYSKLTLLTHFILTLTVHNVKT